MYVTKVFNSSMTLYDRERTKKDYQSREQVKCLGEKRKTHWQCIHINERENQTSKEERNKFNGRGKNTAD